MTNPVKTKDLEIRAAGDDVLVYDSKHGKVHVVNKTAAYILEQCDGTRSPHEIATNLAEASTGEFAAIEKDVESALEAFSRLNLVSY